MPSAREAFADKSPAGDKTKIVGRRPLMTMRAVISMFSALIVLIVALATFLVTYITSLQAVKDVGENYATSLVEHGRDNVQTFFQSHVDLFGAVATQMTVPGYAVLPSLDPTVFTVLNRVVNTLFTLMLTIPDSLLLGHLLWDDGSRNTISRQPINGYDVIGRMSLNAVGITNKTLGCCGVYELHYNSYPSMAELNLPIQASQSLYDARVSGYYTVRRIMINLASGGLWQQVTYNDVVKNPQFCLVLAQVARNGTDFMGIFFATIGMNAVTNYLKQLPVTPNTVVFALDSTGNIAATTHPSPFATFTKTTNKNLAVSGNCFSTAVSATAGVTNYTIACRSPASAFPYAPLQAVASNTDIMSPTALLVSTITVGSDNYYVAATPVKSTLQAFPLSLVLFLPEADVLGNIVQARNIVIGVVVGIFVVATAASFALVTVVLRPLSTISRKMRLTSRLQEVTDSDSNSSSGLGEIHELENAFRGMNTAIRSFTRYVPRDVVKDLLATGQLCQIRMATMRCTMLFVDIAHFTDICERVPAEELSSLTESYFGIMSNTVMSHDGLIDKYIGDCIMAFWGAPFALANPEAKAMLCALQMQSNASHPPLSSAFDEAGEMLAIRVGLATGAVLAGNMGSAERMNYTVIGDSVNLSSRLESLNKQLDTNLLVCTETAQGLHSVFVTRFVMAVRVVGKEQAVDVYEVLGVANPTVPPEEANSFRHQDAMHNSTTDTMSVMSGSMRRGRSERSLDASLRQGSESTVALFDAAVQQRNGFLLVDEETRQEADRLSQAALSYRNGQFAQVIERLNAVSPKVLNRRNGFRRSAELLRDLAESHLRNPPTDFDGVLLFTSK